MVWEYFQYMTFKNMNSLYSRIQFMVHISYDLKGSRKALWEEGCVYFFMGEGKISVNVGKVPSSSWNQLLPPLGSQWWAQLGWEKSMQMSALTASQPQAPPVAPLSHKGQSESTRYSLQLNSMRISVFLPAPGYLEHNQEWKNQGKVLRREGVQSRKAVGLSSQLKDKEK